VPQVALFYLGLFGFLSSLLVSNFQFPVCPCSLFSNF
jgi:hypothetical protein